MRQGNSSAGDIDVRVVPRAGRSEIAGIRDGSVLIRLGAAPVDGAANAELIDVLARALQIPKRNITIVGGERSRNKRVRVAGMNAADVVSRLLPSAG